jgi:hypothetical protein
MYHTGNDPDQLKYIGIGFTSEGLEGGKADTGYRFPQNGGICYYQYGHGGGITTDAKNGTAIENNGTYVGETWVTLKTVIDATGDGSSFTVEFFLDDVSITAGGPQTIARSIEDINYAGIGSYGTNGGDSPVGSIVDNFILAEVVIDETLPIVDAGDNWVAWSGKTLQLDATVVNNNAATDLTYQWTANPGGLDTNTDGTDDHLNIVFSDPTDEDTTVTITKVSGPDPFLIDGRFEHNQINDGSWDSKPDPSWIDGQYVLGIPGVWEVVSSGAGVQDPDTEDWTSGSPYEGENCMIASSYVGEDSGLSQILSSTLEADTDYQISLMVGNPFSNMAIDPTGAAGNYRVELVAGGVVVDSVSGPAPANDTWAAATTLSYNSGAAPAQLGQTLEIRILAEAYGGSDGITDGIDLCFDDVKFTINGALTHMTPPTDDMLSFTLLLAVNNVGSGKPDEVDTVTIKLYDDACKAALGEGLATIDVTDFDGDCITNLADFAVIAIAWLDDYELTEPAAR